MNWNIKRYKVILDYPNSPFEVGEIIIVEDWMFESGWYHNKHGERVESISDIENMPHIFRKLKWWEERSTGEMPKYVKLNSDKKHYFWVAVKNSDLEEFTLLPYEIIPAIDWSEDGDSFMYKGWRMYACNFTPTDKEEYENYVNCVNY